MFTLFTLKLGNSLLWTASLCIVGSLAKRPGLYQPDSRSNATSPTLIETIKNASRFSKCPQGAKLLSSISTHLNGNGEVGYYLRSQIFASVTMGTMRRQYYFEGKGNIFCILFKDF